MLLELLLVLPLGYFILPITYKNYLRYILIRSVIWCIGSYIALYSLYIKYFVGQVNKYVSSTLLPNTMYWVHTFQMPHEHKVETVHVLSQVITYNSTDIYSDIIKNQELKFNIVNCSMLRTTTCESIDVTEIFRKYVYHFDKNDECSKLIYFVKYLEYLHNKDYSEFQFVVYKNDDDFTELTYQISQLDSVYFKDVVSLSTKFIIEDA